MRRLLPVLLAALILSGCGIKQQPANPRWVGTWILQSDPNQTLHFAKDGTVKYVVDVSGQRLEATGIFVGGDDYLITRYNNIVTDNYPAEFEAAARDNILDRDREFKIEWVDQDRHHNTEPESGAVQTWQRL
jgi:hypothetical protein